MYQRVRKLISAKQVKSICPAQSLAVKKAEFDNQIKSIIGGSGKFLLIVGPCSADNASAVLSYCEKLKVVADKVRDKIFIVPRIYTTKPRSKAGAYKGMLHSPDVKNDNMINGILTARKLMADVAEKFGFFAADEMLYPELYPYFDDLISYVTVGARSSENQYHRLVASALDVAVGIKNPMHGNLKSLAQAVLAAMSKNDFVYDGYEVLSDGNAFAHAILRGYTDNKGKMYENFTKEYLDEYVKICAELNMNPSLIIDCNHFNSSKNYLLEPEIAKKAVDALISGNKFIKGLMIESYLLDGKQDAPLNYGMSLTDECLGFEKTEKLIFEIAEKL